MKNEFSDQFYDDKDFFNRSSDSVGIEHENEVGVAVKEQTQASKGYKNDPYGSQEEDDYLFSSSSEDENYNDDPIENSEEESEGEDLAFAESSKERLVDKIKGNLIYVFIALILIIPGAFKLYNMLFATPEMKPAQTTQNVAFDETPTISTASTSAPAVEELNSQENATRSVLDNSNPFGSGSAEKSANMPINEEKLNEEDKEIMAAKEALKKESKSEVSKETSIAANILSSSTGSSEQILDRYFAQESKVEQQLAELLGKMDDIEARLATLDDLDKRLTALENKESTPPQTSGELQQLAERMGQLEQNMNQMRQQVRKSTPAPAATGSNQPTAGASSHAAGISVEAVIPGRAWVRNQEGVLMVVEVGDEIPGVGKVTRIDAREGIVATTTQIFKQ